MKIYVITRGEYSDYHICGVATDKDSAEEKRKAYSYHNDEAEIEEYDTEDEMPEYMPGYWCSIGKDGTIIAEGPRNTINEDLDVRKDWNGNIYTIVQADSAERAVKVAAERFAKWKYEQFSDAEKGWFGINPGVFVSEEKEE